MGWTRAVIFPDALMAAWTSWRNWMKSGSSNGSIKWVVPGWARECPLGVVKDLGFVANLTALNWADPYAAGQHTCKLWDGWVELCQI